MPATMLCVLAPYLLAGGRDPLTIVAIMALAIPLHYFSFGHNSVMDYWLDIHDPNKKHHPLVSGKIRLDDAHKVIHCGWAIISVVLVFFTWYVSPNPVYALAALIFYLVFGHAYNDGLDHHTVHSWVPICLCFTSLVAYGWFLATGAVDLRFALVLSWAFLTIFYQIAWEGNLKDVFNPEERKNLLRRLGYVVVYEYDDGVYGSVEIKSWFSMLMMFIRVGVNLVIIMLLIALTYSDMFSLAVACAVLFVLSFIENIEVANIHGKLRYFSRQEMLEHFGKAEAVEFFRILTPVVAMGDLPLFLVIVTYSILYFVLMNRILWGTRFGPKV